MSLNTHQIQQQEFLLNPSSLSEYKDSLYHSLSLFLLCLNTSSNTTCFHFLPVCDFKGNRHYLFISSSQLSVSLPLFARIPLLSISNHGITPFGEVATCSAMDECIGPLKSLKQPFSVYIEKCIQT